MDLDLRRFKLLCSRELAITDRKDTFKAMLKRAGHGGLVIGTVLEESL